jgi:hypothetical protein
MSTEISDELYCYLERMKAVVQVKPVDGLHAGYIEESYEKMCDELLGLLIKAPAGESAQTCDWCGYDEYEGQAGKIIYKKYHQTCHHEITS